MTAQETITAGVAVKTSHKSIYSALAAAQTAMGPALKESANPAFKSRYADLANVMAACMPALNANGIAVIQPTVDEENQRYVKTILAHESGETLECRVPLIVGKNDMQGYGSAVTYARRYGLMCMAGIAPEDDDGNAAAKSPPIVERNNPPRDTGPTDAPDPRAEFEAAVSQAVRGIGREPNHDSLSEMFKDLYRRQRSVADDPRVIKAKDDRKAALQPKPNADLADEIPY